MELRNVVIKEVGYFFAHDFMSRPAIHFLRAHVPIAYGVVEAPHEDRVIGVVEQRGLFHDADFRFLPVSDVMDSSDKVDAMAASIKNRRDTDISVPHSCRIFGDFLPSN